MTDPVGVAESLVKISSPSGDEGELAQELSRRLRSFCEVEQGPCGTVIGRIHRGDGPTVLLEGHMDTVPVGDLAAWSRPSGGQVQDGVLWGRGAVDMKGAIAAQLAGAEAVAGNVGGTLLLLYVTHEETAEGVALAKALEELPRPDVVILGEPTDLRLALGHRGRAVLRVETRGQAAHASMPDLGKNALCELIDVLGRTMELPLPVDPMLGKATVTPVAMGGGQPGPVVPVRGWALLDRRGVRGESEESLLGIHQGLPVTIEETEVEFYTGERFTVRQFFPAWWVDPEDPWAAAAWEALRRPPFRVWRFSTDGVESCGRRGIPTLGYGPGDERCAHRVDEGVHTSAVSQAAEGYRRLLTSLMEQPSPKQSPWRTRADRPARGR